MRDVEDHSASAVALAERRAAIGNPDLPHRRRRTPSKKALLKAIEAAGGVVAIDQQATTSSAKLRVAHLRQFGQVGNFLPSSNLALYIFAIHRGATDEDEAFLCRHDGRGIVWLRHHEEQLHS